MPRTMIGLAAALALSLAASSLPARAGDSGFFDREPVRAWHGQRFAVMQIDSIDQYEALRSILESRVRAAPGQIAALQEAIRGNRALAAALQARSVQIRNIVAIQEGLNGNLTFYLR